MNNLNIDPGTYRRAVLAILAKYPDKDEHAAMNELERTMRNTDVEEWDTDTLGELMQEEFDVRPCADCGRPCHWVEAICDYQHIPANAPDCFLISSREVTS